MASMIISIGSYTGIQFDYLLNQSEIIDLFCINKDKPEMQCNGKCHLKKQFEELADKTESPANPEEVKEAQFNLFFERTEQSLAVFFDYDSNFTCGRLFQLSSGFSSLYLEPPQV